MTRPLVSVIGPVSNPMTLERSTFTDAVALVIEPRPTLESQGVDRPEEVVETCQQRRIQVHVDVERACPAWSAHR